MKRFFALLIATPQLASAAAPAEAAAPESALAPAAPAVNVEEDAGPAGASGDEVSGPEDASEAPAFNYGAEVDVSSRYMSRGIAWSERPVLQPSGRIVHRGVTLAMGGNAYLTDEAAADSGFSELDLFGKYDLVLGRATLSPSVGAYIYPDEVDTAELGAALAYNLDIVTLQTRQALDILDNAGGWYGDVGAVRTQPIGSRLSLETTASVAWCSGSFSRYYVDDSIEGLHFGAAILDSSLTLAATDSVYLRLHGTFSRMLEQRMRQAAGDDNLLGGGLALGVAR
jgi:hypothetical protein